MATAVIQTAGQFRRRAAHPADREISNRAFAIDQDDHFGNDAAQQVLPVAVGGSWCLPDDLQIGSSSSKPLRISLTQRRGPTPPESVQLILALCKVFQAFFPCTLQRTCYQTVLRFDARELTLGTLRFVTSSLHQHLALVALLPPAFFRFLECSQGCIDAGRRQRS